MNTQSNQNKEAFHSGFAGLIGRPNVGKSTLLNAMIGQKISITSHKPQTTRHRINGIITTEHMQLILVDTPGMHSQGIKKSLNRQLNQTAQSVLSGVDCILWLVEALKFTGEDQAIATLLKNSDIPVIVLINKIDRVSKRERLLPEMANLHDVLPTAQAIIPISAQKKLGLSELETQIVSLLPVAEAPFLEDMVTDKSERFICAEIIREKLTRRLNKEIPYGIAVMIETFEVLEQIVNIRAVIYVERQGHKGIVVGNRGETLKWVGTNARLDMEQLLEKKVFLKLWVKVRANWSDDEQAIQALGYDTFS